MGFFCCAISRIYRPLQAGETFSVIVFLERVGGGGTFHMMPRGDLWLAVTEFEIY
jgi:hypothetical protein